MISTGTSTGIASVIFDAASDGKHVVLGMLVVGLIFLATIGIGELTHYLGHRRAERKRQVY
jgi:hypothetical protein